MNYKISSLQPILNCFKEHPRLTPSQLALILGKSKVIVHKYLKHLLEEKKIEKHGLGTHAYYTLVGNISLPDIKKVTQILPFAISEELEGSFYKFSESGKLLEGTTGFTHWCDSRGLNPEEKAKVFIKIKKHIATLKDECGLIDVKKVFIENIGKVYLDEVYYADQYNWMEFGRGKLAEMTFFAKQSQNIALIEQSISLIIRQLECLIHTKKIDALCITPPSVMRKNQLLKFLEKKLGYLGLPLVKVSKYYEGGIPIPQKTLKTRDQRQKNAENTIFIEDKNLTKYKKILLIDDFVGSGSTLNILGKKLKEKGAGYIVGFAFVGNTNLSYEVINEI